MGKNSGDTTTTLRVYIWPRISVTGTDYGLELQSVVITQIDVVVKRQPGDVTCHMRNYVSDRYNIVDKM